MLRADSPLRCAYRLQLQPGFGFAEARELVPYLRRLGVSHLYLSPVTTARPGSTHGYDVVDPTRVSEELGGEEGLRELAGDGLGLIVDVVPNHQATDEESNPLWRDPLWRARFFDLDWRTGAHRRFFDVSELAGVRVEDPEVFEVTHRKVLELVRDGIVQGVRVDHPDGLSRPRRYFERLREAGVRHVWAEKILHPSERMRGWAVEGTTGYEFLNDVTALFVDPWAEEPLTQFYEARVGESRSFADVARAAKLDEAQTTFADDLDRLQALLAQQDGPPLDLPREAAKLEVYRTYADPETGAVDAEDRRWIESAGFDRALASLLTLERRGHDAFVLRFQQTTPAIAAKGVEDTALYRWNRLLALNEVGGDPQRFTVSVERFHLANAVRADTAPLGLLTTMTHDAKRSADVRARLCALSHHHGDWLALADAVLRRNTLPCTPNQAYLVVQTLVGAWPLEAARRRDYLRKAFREEKLSTSWTAPDEDWEGRVLAWADALATEEAGRFARLAERIAPTAHHISLGMVALKLTCPGVPDLYQGDECELLALVDPDNRRPVDWPARRALLPTASPLSKIGLVRDLLALRARQPEAFAGTYDPLDTGPAVVGFQRGGEVAVLVALRPGAMARTQPPAGAWRDVLPPSDTIRVLERVRPSRVASRPALAVARTQS